MNCTRLSWLDQNGSKLQGGINHVKPRESPIHQAFLTRSIQELEPIYDHRNLVCTFGAEEIEHSFAKEMYILAGLDKGIYRLVNHCKDKDHGCIRTRESAKETCNVVHM